MDLLNNRDYSVFLLQRMNNREVRLWSRIVILFWVHFYPPSLKLRMTRKN